MTEHGPVGGNTLDQALWSAPGAGAGGGSPSKPHTTHAWPSSRSTTSGSWPRCGSRRPDGTGLVVTKGAPEVVLDRCIDVPTGARSALDALFSEGARVVAVATRPAEGTGAPTAADERSLRLEGFLTFADRPKADAGASIAKLQRLGVDVKIITGDNGLVAAKVCSGHRGRLHRGAQR